MYELWILLLVDIMNISCPQRKEVPFYHLELLIMLMIKSD